MTISLTPDEVEQRLSRLGLACPFTEQERQQFASAPDLKLTAPTFRFPTPGDNTGLTLSKIRAAAGVDPSHQPSVFDHPWYADETFMNTPCRPGWHILYVDVLQESIGQAADYIRSLGSQGLELPNAVEVVLMLFLHYLGTGEQLLARKHTWCGDVASGGRVVTVGAFGRNGVFLSAHPPGFGSRGLGICPRIRVPS